MEALDINSGALFNGQLASQVVWCHNSVDFPICTEILNGAEQILLA